MIKILNVIKKFNYGTRQITAIDDISLDINEGDFVAFTGQSGAGKTTLLSMIGGLLKPSSGDIVYKQHHLSKLNPSQLENTFLKNIGFIFQNTKLFEHLNIIENIMISVMFKPKLMKRARENAEHLIEELSLKSNLSDYPTELSGGELQKISIIRTIISEPEILIADEPTGDLDPETCKKIGSIFKNANRNGNTIILSTHSKELADISSTIFLMQNGKIDKMIKKRKRRK